MKKTDAELFRMDEPNVAVQTIATKFPKSSRIDIIGQNGNTGDHYKPKGYAIQTIFQYGWDYIGYDDKDGLREVFKTKKAAQKELNDILELTKDDAVDWQIVPYNPNEDDSFARF